MDVGAAEELLRNKCGITARTVWQIAGTSILIAEAILIFFQGIKRFSTVLLGFFLWKKCVSFEKTEILLRKDT